MFRLDFLHLVDYGRENGVELPAYPHSLVHRVRCKLVSEEPAPARRVMDPSLDDPDRHDLYDPRNPLNLRKRGAVTDDSGRDDRSHHKRSRK